MHWLYKRRYERNVKHKLAQIRGEVFWDIGANIGFYSLMLRDNFSKIVAVEPNPETAATLRRRVKEISNIEILEVALSNRSGPALLYTQKGAFSIDGFNNKNGSDSIFSRVVYKSGRDSSNDRIVERRPSIPILTKTFDEMNAGIVDLVKIDVEGAEFEVLEGMKDSLIQRSLRRLLVELHDRDDKTKLESVLTRCGYSVEWVDPDHLFATAN